MTEHGTAGVRERPAPRRGRPPAEHRTDEILAAAITVFARKGFRSSSMTDVAEAAGMSKPGLYHHFSSKEELLVRIYRSALDRNVQHAEEIMAESGAPTKKLSDILARLAVHSCENRDLVRIFNEEEAAVPASVMTVVHAAHRDRENLLVDLIEQGINSGEFHLSVSPRLAARAMIGAVNLCYKWFEPSGSRSAGEIGADMADFLVAGLIGRGGGARETPGTGER